MRRYLMLAARLLFALYFGMATINYILNYSQTIQGMTRVGVPIPELVLPITIVLFAAAVVALIVGWKAHYFAAGLAVAMVIITLFYHSAIGDPLQLRAFLSNFAVIAGLLMLVANGSGPLSVDEGHGIEEPEGRVRRAA